MHNLAGQHPELVKKMECKWQEWAHQYKVLPKPVQANK